MASIASAPRVGVGVIITKDQQVLLLRRRSVHGAGTRSTPGGHLDFGETPEQCAVREVKEETGLDIDAVAFRAITNDVFVVEGLHYLTIWMEGRYTAGEPILAAPYEASEIGWFSWSALPQPLFLPLQHLLAGNCYPSPGR